MLSQDQIRGHIENLWMRWVGLALAVLLMVLLEGWSLGLTAGLMLAQGLIIGASIAYYEVDRAMQHMRVGS